MGIETQWKAIMRDDIGWPEMPAEAATRISVIIDDWLLNQRRVIHGVLTWDDLGARARARVSIMTDRPNITVYYMLWDEKYVPRNKDVVRRKRAAYSKHKPFTPEEASKITIGVGTIPNPESFFGRLLVTREMHSAFYAFIAQQLAMIKMPVGTSLYLDGVRAHGIVQLARSGKASLRFTNFTIPTSELQVMSIMDQRRLDETGIVRITSSGSNNTVQLLDSRGVGEADLKIPAVIAEQPAGAHIFCRICDTDIFPTLLFNMRNYICMKQGGENGIAYGMVKYGIYVETDGPGRKMGTDPTPVLDMVEFWREVLDFFNTHHPMVSFPAETMASLMLASGSDYTDSMQQLGPMRIWDAFNCVTGRNILFDPRQHGRLGVWVDDVRGDADTRIRVAFEENRMFHFIVYAYHRFALKKVPWTGQNTLEILRKERHVIAQRVIAENKKPTAANSWHPPSDKHLRALIRRWHWNADYLTNGAKKDPYMNPVYMDPTSGLSWHGWVEDAAGKVQLAEEIHTFRA